MKKVDLIEYIRTLEHNYNVAVSFNENQVRYIESLGITGVVRCKDCKHYREGFCFCKNWWKDDGFTEVGETDFCSYGERKDNG